MTPSNRSRRTPDKLTELPGIGDRMAEHILEILKTGEYSLRAKLLKKFPPTLAGSYSIAIAGAEEGGISVVHISGGDGGGRGAAGERGQAAGFAGLWGEDRAEHFESGGSAQARHREIAEPTRPSLRRRKLLRTYRSWAKELSPLLRRVRCGG